MVFCGIWGVPEMSEVTPPSGGFIAPMHASHYLRGEGDMG
jgi:hypothetical protein